MANSLIVGGLKVGMNVAVATPDGYKPDGAVLEFTKGYGDKFALETDPFMAASGADILITDIRMPGMTGLDLQRRFVEAGSRLPVIFLTGHGDVATAVHTMKYGALYFLEKRGDPMVLAAAVERACKKSLAAAKAAAEAQSYQAAYDALTPREREVFVLAAKGLSNKEAAEVLGIGAETVKMHKANAYAKLGVQSSLEAYQWLENLPTPQPKDVP